MPVTAPFDWEHLQWHLDPIAIQLGPLAVRWYGLMYAVAFGVAYWLVMRRLKHETWEISRDHVDRLLTWAVGGVLIGGRIGYVLFYNWGYFSHHPLEIFFPFGSDAEGGVRFTGISGMSYHGGLAGFAIGHIIFSLRNRINPLRFADLIVPAIPLGYMFGRFGNFINGELWGRVTDVAWAMRFPSDTSLGSPLNGIAPPLRHPSQLYEAFGEGLLIWAILWGLKNRPFFKGRMFALYLIGYGLVRFAVEFTREPDAQLGFVLGSLSMGQVLCSTMILVGTTLLFFPAREVPVRG
ncbi:MAG TPA: prolipoprotein diacylglyceryl transferase [Fibrobacteria bacterium]|nr:prolipoprotein diacylglyceryl transferase [Fibrobacteria bacterium]HOX51448.1 prolipoprotein diacylglyceryl transferase [Fibrobacteria bacterium]